MENEDLITVRVRGQLRDTVAATAEYYGLSRPGLVRSILSSVLLRGEEWKMESVITGQPEAQRKANPYPKDGTVNLQHFTEGEDMRQRVGNANHN